MEAGLLEKTGKPLGHWVNVVIKQKLEKHGEMIAFLKAEHGFTHGFANFVAIKVREAEFGAKDESQLITDQYAKKSNLKPIYDLLHQKITGLAKSVEVAPKKTSVSFRGLKRQFALIQPSTKTRIDLGLKLNDTPYKGRLETSGPFGSMCTHRVQITDAKQVDKELIGWIKQAYQESN